jgi:hypothetical protein
VFFNSKVVKLSIKVVRNFEILGTSKFSFVSVTSEVSALKILSVLVALGFVVPKKEGD